MTVNTIAECLRTDCNSLGDIKKYIKTESCPCAAHENLILGSRSTVPLLLDPGTRWNWVVNFKPRPPNPGGPLRSLAPNSTRWATETVWKLRRKSKIFCGETSSPQTSHCADYANPAAIFSRTTKTIGDRGGTVVKVLCYKSESRWFDSGWCHWNFSLT